MEEEFQTLSFFFLSKGKRYTVQGLPACAKGRTRNMGSIEALARPRHSLLPVPASSQQSTRHTRPPLKVEGHLGQGPPLPPSLRSRDPQPPPVAEDGLLLRSSARPVLTSRRCSKMASPTTWATRLRYAHSKMRDSAVISLKVRSSHFRSPSFTSMLPQSLITSAVCQRIEDRLTSILL